MTLAAVPHLPTSVQSRFAPRSRRLLEQMDACERALQRALLPRAAGYQEMSALVSICVPHRFEPKQVIFSRHAQAKSLWLVGEGSAVVGLARPSGWKVERTVEAGGWLDSMSAWLESDYPCDARTVKEATVFELPRKALEDVAYIHPGILLLLLTSVSAQARRATEGVMEKLHQLVPSRLASWLVTGRRQAGGEDIEITQGKACLASELGTSAETLSRTLRRFREEGLIEVRGPRVTILDEVGLGKLAAARSEQ